MKVMLYDKHSLEDKHAWIHTQVREFLFLLWFTPLRTKCLTPQKPWADTSKPDWLFTQSVRLRENDARVARMFTIQKFESDWMWQEKLGKDWDMYAAVGITNHENEIDIFIWKAIRVYIKKTSETQNHFHDQFRNVSSTTYEF